jgi:hypothetical protein
MAAGPRTSAESGLTKIQIALGHKELTHIRFSWLFSEEEVRSVEFDGEVAMVVVVHEHPSKG